MTTQSQSVASPTAVALNRSWLVTRSFDGARRKRLKMAVLSNNPSLDKQIGVAGGSLERTGAGTLSSMGLADAFEEIVDSLPDDWTDLEIDLRLADEDRYVDAAVLLTQVNAQPYSKADWHWRLLIAHRFGHAAAAETVKGTLSLLDQEGIEGEMVLREVREGRAEVVQMWGRPESVRREFRRSRSL
jgi:hypothetical protein